MPLFIALEDWTAAGHAGELADRVVVIVGFAAVLAVALLCLRALIRHGRYRAVGVLSEKETSDVRSEIASQERLTKGEIAVVVLEESDAHPQACWLAAVACVLAAAALLTGLIPSARAAVILPVLIAGGAIGYGLARVLPDFRRNFVAGRRAMEMAEEQALQEFAGLGMHRTEGRTGLLILVSLFEQAVIVLADDGIHGKAGEEPWIEANRLILAGVREGSLPKGLVAGVQSVGAVLARHFPRAGGDVNELPDHLIVRRR
jgi:putative membrane protein